jgi:uncharacterized protein YneF (UPF0154 family)
MRENGEISTSSASAARSFGQIASAIIHDFQDFFIAEAKLAAAELKDKKYARAGGMLAVAGLFGFFAFACLTTTFIVALAIVLPLWLSALIIAVLFGFIAGGAFLLGRMALERIDPLPRRALQLFREMMERIASRSQ